MKFTLRLRGEKCWNRGSAGHDRRVAADQRRREYPLRLFPLEQVSGDEQTIERTSSWRLTDEAEETAPAPEREMADLARISEFPAQLHSRFPKHKESTVFSSDGEQTLDGICARSQAVSALAVGFEGGAAAHRRRSQSGLNRSRGSPTAPAAKLPRCARPKLRRIRRRLRAPCALSKRRRSLRTEALVRIDPRISRRRLLSDSA